MVTYIDSLDTLYNAAVENLGLMDSGSFSDFEKKVLDAAKRHNISNPLMLIDVKFKEDMLKKFDVVDQPYMVEDHQWAGLIEDVKLRDSYMPSVFIVDGDLYSLRN